MATRWVGRMMNRNPRNLEMLGLQPKPKGFEFEKDANLKSFIYKIELIQTKSHQEARVIHYKDGVVLTASTQEKAISNQLYSNTDTCASMNLARVMASRCLQSAVLMARPAITDEQMKNSKHQSQFFETLETEGIILTEPEAIEQSYETDKHFTWERYPLKNTRQDKLDE